MTAKSIHSLLLLDPLLQSLFSLKENDLFFNRILNKKQIPSFLNDLHSENIDACFSEYEQKGIFAVTLADPDYPSLLKKIYHCPPVLYGAGKRELLSCRKKISIVGTRVPTEEGRKAAELLVPALTESGWVIVSGLAKGIDAMAHELAIGTGGRGIGVIGGGFWHLYPASSRKLAKSMMKEHLLLSEYAPETAPERWHFPARNRIIAGLSYGTLVIQAKLSSGSLITAHQALEEGREVFAVPGPIHLEQSKGVNKLIQDGAKLVMKASDVDDEFPFLEKKGSFRQFTV
ncbi:DNA-processing protein DprA [Metabacillus sp. GX 13764]|uniref:DNA-processing protein DprA n=1 Tax=Metabacillus kandeliae TaxID=2900151 RepID=UPI001E30F900|nr:DNA-processing protein DprA [Metabacillus kandeliae]MCD7033794.1 DNA-processing protein DprA [Metabacillus kandeliae]